MFSKALPSSLLKIGCLEWDSYPWPSNYNILCPYTELWSVVVRNWPNLTRGEAREWGMPKRKSLKQLLIFSKVSKVCSLFWFAASVISLFLGMKIHYSAMFTCKLSPMKCDVNKGASILSTMIIFFSFSVCKPSQVDEWHDTDMRTRVKSWNHFFNSVRQRALMLS